VRAAGKKKPISVQKCLHHDLSHSYSSNLSQRAGHLLSAIVVCVYNKLSAFQLVNFSSYPTKSMKCTT